MYSTKRRVDHTSSSNEMNRNRESSPIKKNLIIKTNKRVEIIKVYLV